MAKKFEVEKDFHNTRFDRWFKNKILDIPQGLIEKIIRKNQVKVNGKKTKSSYRVQETDVVEIFNIDKIKQSEKKIITQYIPTNTERDKYDDFIIENNENFLVINKPSGIAVQSGTKSFKNVVDTLRGTKYFENSKPFIVHRLDKETSGILIVAKNREYAQLFTSLFRIRKIHKTYLAVVYGEVKKEIRLLEDELILFENKRKIVQKATSYLKILKSNAQYSLVELRPITGRKHQLRKQLYNIGNSIIGDDKYYVKKSGVFIKSKNLMLHAYEIKFMINNVKYNFKANYNKDFENFLIKKDLNIF
ncbi:MAG: RluA family pseudouridine synthase [Pelagibacteraceae bacterium]|jgi:23S rRNA pseudouridine955/2504/2580 synthase|nr:RluA family pseudouridine synthase [Pelagibacteraceae bacterium]